MIYLDMNVWRARSQWHLIYFAMIVPEPQISKEAVRANQQHSDAKISFCRQSL